ncbi:hypothetical protein GQ600_15237 [Phytophthora cactorum]|nr:hypothetical protein GQ600_15237 [Phytophthora cactorum]
MCGNTTDPGDATCVPREEFSFLFNKHILPWKRIIRR